MVQVSDLLWVTVSISPTHIEDVLTQIAQLPEPVNCDVRYADGQMLVGFPAYRQWMAAIRETFGANVVARCAVALPSCK